MPAKDYVLRALFEIAERDPDRILFSFVDEQGKDAKTRTAGQLVKRIVRLAAYLSDGCGLVPGDTALLIYPPSMEFVEAFAACLLAGIVAAPVYPPNVVRPHNDLVRLTAIAKQSGAKAILTNRAYRWAARMSAAKELLADDSARWPALPWYVTQGLLWFQAKLERPRDCRPSDVAILQFTSGSTATPKGVRITHQNLIHQLALNAELLGMNDDARLVMWVPQYHDLGLISGIAAILRGHGALWFMSPLSFLQRPALWFETMHRVRATHTASPNFGYELACRKTTPAMRAQWDLRSVRIFMNAAEPIVPLTMDNFIGDFATTGLSAAAFCPAYGLAEHTVGVTLGGRARVRLDRQTLVSQQRASIGDSGDLELVGCGPARCGVEVRIVSPTTLKALGPHQVGEIWVQSPSVADGYQGLDELNQATFKATLADESGGWLRTGDLGFLHEDELFITGRQKDLVIIRGRNMHPEDIEESIRRVHPGIRSGGVAAFSVPGKATEELVVLVEITDTDALPHDEILLAVQRRIGEVWQVQCTVALLPKRSLKKTTSGKLQRAACRQAWLDGQLELVKLREPVVGTPLPPLEAGSLQDNVLDVALEDRVDWMLQLIRQLALSKLGESVAHLRPDDFLPDAGLDSLSGSDLLMLLQQRLQRPLSNTLFIEHPTLRRAAMRILTEMEVEFLGAPDPVELETALPFRPPHRAMPPAATKIGIVGGGVGGLIAALELARTGYRNIVIFEAASQCGGKVLTKKVGDENVELGQNFFGDSFRLVLETAMELGCKLLPAEQAFWQWDEKYGLEQPPVRRTAKSWFQAIVKASRTPMNPAQPFPSLYDGADLPFSAYLQRHRLPAPHPLYFLDWNGMGYGMDTEISAAYTLAYFSLAGAIGSTCYLADGSQSLWLRLAKHLQDDWGVTLLLNQKVEEITGDESGVRVRSLGQQFRFDELILAVPPNQLPAILAKDDPLQPLLGEFEYQGYAVRSFRAEGLIKEGVVFMPQHTRTPGRTILIQACHRHEGWYICGQYTSSFAKVPEHLPDQVMNQEISDLVQQMGGRLIEFGPHYTWDYFPHVRNNATAVLRQIEGMQGLRHIWTTGSWLSFETTEHVTRHARHLIRTCFDPAFVDARTPAGPAS